MTETRFDPRICPFTKAIADNATPQAVFSERASARTEVIDGIVHLYRLEDILKINRHPSVLGVGGRGGSFATDMPLIPLEIDGPEHAKWRRLLDPLFAPKEVARLEAGIRVMAAELLDGFAGKSEVELYQAFCVPLPCLTFLRLMGIPAEDLGFFLEFKEGVIHPAGETVEEMNANMVEAGMKLYEYFGDFIARRTEEGSSSDDLVGILLGSELDGEPLTDFDLLNILFLFMFAGLDTVSAALSCLFSWLAAHPDERRRLVEDPALIPNAVEELLRYESPVPGAARYAEADIDLGDGLVIEAGTAMYALWATANVDPTAFPDPLRVDFDRPRNTHIAFASGTHRCLGSHLARLELRIALEEFHRRIPEYSMAGEPRFDNVAVRTARYLPLALGT